MFCLDMSSGDKTLERGVICSVTLLVFIVSLASGQERSSTEQQKPSPATANQPSLPQLPPIKPEQADTTKGVKARVVPGRTVGHPTLVDGPFREGTTGLSPVRKHSPGDDETAAPSRLAMPSERKPSVTGAKVANPRITLELAGSSALEAASKLFPPGSKIKPFSGNTGESFLPASMRSPAVTTFWQNGASQNGGGDPQVAVSRTTVAVLSWSTLAFYDKAGTLLPSFKNPTDMPTLFANLLPAVDASLNLNPAVANDPEYKICSAYPATMDTCPGVGDARVVFDAIHNRWVVLATAKNGAKSKDPSRRTKFLLAVSLDEDPSKGFYTYFSNGTPNDGACNSLNTTLCPGTAFTPGNAGDYPSLGVSDQYYLLTDHADHPDGSWAYLVAIDAHEAMNGLPHPHSYHWWGWDVGNGQSATFVTMPVVNHDKLSPIDAGMIVDTEGDTISITFLTGNPPQLGTVYWDMPNQKGPTAWFQKGSFDLINDGNVGNKPITAFELNGTVLAAFNDCRKWADSQNDCSPSLHVVSADVPSFPVVLPNINRLVGWRNATDDSPDDVVAYGMPGIAMNKDKDIAVVYTRSSPLMYPEVRYSTWMHSEFDIRPSRPLKNGDGPIPASGPTQPVSQPCVCLVIGNCPSSSCMPLRTDTAGIALDPFDRTAIWMVHDYADSNGTYSMTVGKVFGKAYPDLTVPNVDFKPLSAHAADPLQVSFTVHNGGDGGTSNVRAEIRLVSLVNPGQPHIWLGDDAIRGDLASGASVDRTFSATVPSGTAPGRYAVEVEAKIRGGNMTEYSTDNNTGQHRILEVLPSPPPHAVINPSLLLPEHAFPGGLVTGAVLDADGHPVANTPVEVLGGVSAELTREVIGKQACPTDNPNCQPPKSARKPFPGDSPEPPVDCAAVLQKAGETTAPPTTRTTTPQSSTSVGTQRVVTDADGLFAVCVSPAAPELNVNLPGGVMTRLQVDRNLATLPERLPDSFPPGQKISIEGLIRNTEATQGGRAWLLPVVQAWSPDGRRAISVLRMPNELAPGPAQLSYTGTDGQRRTMQGTVFRIPRAVPDHSQLHRNKGATFEHEEQSGP